MTLKNINVLMPIDLDQQTTTVLKTLEIDLGELVQHLRTNGAIPSVAVLGDYADDTAAAAGGVAVGGAYRTGSSIKVRIA